MNYTDYARLRQNGMRAEPKPPRPQAKPAPPPQPPAQQRRYLPMPLQTGYQRTRAPEPPKPPFAQPPIPRPAQTPAPIQRLDDQDAWSDEFARKRGPGTSFWHATPTPVPPKPVYYGPDAEGAERDAAIRRNIERAARTTGKTVAQIQAEIDNEMKAEAWQESDPLRAATFTQYTINQKGINPGFDWQQFKPEIVSPDALDENVGGYYDPWWNRIVVGYDDPTIMTHELAHGYQQQQGARNYDRYVADLASVAGAPYLFAPQQPAYDADLLGDRWRKTVKGEEYHNGVAWNPREIYAYMAEPYSQNKYNVPQQLWPYYEGMFPNAPADYPWPTPQPVPTVPRSTPTPTMTPTPTYGVYR